MKLTNVSQRVCYIYKVVYQNVGTSALLSSEPEKVEFAPLVLLSALLKKFHTLCLQP